jgi:hypothetical protein
LSAVTHGRDIIIADETRRRRSLATALLTVAIIGIVRPVIIVRWAKRTHPQLDEDDQSVLWIARLVGIGGLGVTAFFWMIIFRSLF